MSYDAYKLMSAEDAGFYGSPTRDEDDDRHPLDELICIRTGISADQREPWLAARREYVCSSEVAAMLGEAPFKDATRGRVLLEKAGLGDPWEGSEQTQLGLDLEPAIARAAARRWGWKLFRCAELIVDSECHALAATPDYLVEGPWGLGCVQVKLTTCQAAEDCKPKKDGSPSTAAYAGGAPLYHQLQQQAELACLGLKWSALLVLHACAPSFKLRAYALQRHDDAIARIRREAVLLMDEVRAVRNGRIAV